MRSRSNQVLGDSRASWPPLTASVRDVTGAPLAVAPRWVREERVLRPPARNEAGEPFCLSALSSTPGREAVPVTESQRLPATGGCASILVITVDELSMEHSVACISHDQLAWMPAGCAEIRDSLGILERFTYHSL